jgi:5-methylcytosine-specific restriction endonuclease McrA
VHNGKPCRDCGAVYEPWNQYSGAGTSSTRCLPCYRAYSRSTPSYIRKNGRPGRARSDIPGIETPHGVVRFHSSGRPQGAAWERIRAIVMAEETHCHICGEHVDQTLNGRHPDGPTVDHVISLNEGGDPVARNNLRLAHLLCNSRGGGKMRSAALQRQRAEHDAILRFAIHLGTLGL